MRRLEIGPGPVRLPGFETLNVVKTPVTDHVGDARRPPFRSGTFDLVYSSHCIEHVEWHEIEETIREWVRILKPGGVLEVHTVNGYAMMKALVEMEGGESPIRATTWRTDLHHGDPYKWAVGRLLNYAKKGEGGTHWMHRSILTPAYMTRCFLQAGLNQIEAVAEPRGDKKHRSINMGLRGVKC